MAGDGAGDVSGAGVGVTLPVGVSVVGAGSVAVAGDCAGDVAAELAAAWLLGDADADVVVGDVDVDVVDGDGLGDLLGVVGGVVGGLDGGVEVTLSLSHCQIVGAEFTLPETTPDPPPGDEARVCGAMATVTTNPAAVVSKTPPALRPIDAGRTRAKHM